MSAPPALFARPQFDVPCVIDVENSFESLHAHVDLPDGIEVGPGDVVRVHGERIVVPYGAKLRLERTATVRRANLFDKLVSRLKGELESLMMFEVSFSSGGKL